jgi:hypothetical protein
VLFTCAASHTKSKGFPIDGPLASITFLLVIIADPDCQIIVLFIQQSLWHVKSKGQLYMYTQQVFDKGQIFFYINKYLRQHTGEELHIPRIIIVFRLDKAREVVR